MDKSNPAGKVGEGEALVLPEDGEASGTSPANAGDATTASTTGLVDLNAEFGTDNAATMAGDGTPQNGQSIAAVARGAAAHGIAAAAEVAAVVARISPQQVQAQAGGLPAQAAELERAVRSLQSRWMQIQDVVAGMQQMLQYIEESQSMMSAARAAEQQQEAGGAEEQQQEVGAADEQQQETTSAAEAVVADADRVLTEAAETQAVDSAANAAVHEAVTADEERVPTEAGETDAINSPAVAAVPEDASAGAADSAIAEQPTCSALAEEPKGPWKLSGAPLRR